MLSEIYDMTMLIKYVTCDWVVGKIVGNIFKSIVFVGKKSECKR